MNPETPLYRLIHKNWLPGTGSNGDPKHEVQRLAFKPTKKDNKLLSVYFGDELSPEDAWRYVPLPNKQENYAGVLAVTLEECTKLGLPVLYDEDELSQKIVHASISFEGETTNAQIKNKAEELRNFAMARGWRYKP